MDNTQKISVGEILSAWIAAIGRHGSVCLLAGGLIAVVGTLMDTALGERGGQLVASITSFFIGYHFVEYVLARDFGARIGKRRYGSAFIAGILGLLGICAGIVVLIVPGLYIAARWSLANALVIGEGLDGTESLRESWRRTESHAWTILICYLLLGLVFLGGAIGFGVVIALAGGPAFEGSFAASLVGNALSGALSVIAGLLGCALYGLIGKPTAALDDVFS